MGKRSWLGSNAGLIRKKAAFCPHFLLLSSLSLLFTLLAWHPCPKTPKFENRLANFHLSNAFTVSLRSFRLGTFNLFNLLLPHQPYYGRHYSQALYDQKVAWTARQLDYMSADIVGFQEVFHEKALREVVQASAFLRGHQVIVAGETGDLPRVGLATRFKVLGHQVYTHFPEALAIEGTQIPLTNFSRPILRAELELKPGLVVTAFVVHLKSKRPLLENGEDRKDPFDLAKGQARALVRRGLEAMALRHLLLETLQHSEHPVILMGDVNDSGLAVTSRLLSGDPPHRHYPLDVKKRLWDVLLYHVKDIQARRSYHDFYYTHIHNGFHEALDHIMVSQEFVSENPRSIARIGYVTIFNDHLMDETLSDERPELWQSDHGQVVAEVELRGE
jgi:endonuclease/exonuclease/phosphatase family metal-dependent hydrolase